MPTKTPRKLKPEHLKLVTKIQNLEKKILDFCSDHKILQEVATAYKKGLKKYTKNQMARYHDLAYAIQSR